MANKLTYKEVPRWEFQNGINYIHTHTHTHTRIYQNGNINCGFLFNSVITKQSS